MEGCDEGLQQPTFSFKHTTSIDLSWRKLECLGLNGAARPANKRLTMSFSCFFPLRRKQCIFIFLYAMMVILILEKKAFCFI